MLAYLNKIIFLFIIITTVYGISIYGIYLHGKDEVAIRSISRILNTHKSYLKRDEVFVANKSAVSYLIENVLTDKELCLSDDRDYIFDDKTICQKVIKNISDGMGADYSRLSILKGAFQGDFCTYVVLMGARTLDEVVSVSINSGLISRNVSVRKKDIDLIVSRCGEASENRAYAFVQDDGRYGGIFSNISFLSVHDADLLVNEGKILLKYMAGIDINLSNYINSLPDNFKPNKDWLSGHYVAFNDGDLYSNLRYISMKNELYFRIFWPDKTYDEAFNQYNSVSKVMRRDLLHGYSLIKTFSSPVGEIKVEGELYLYLVIISEVFLLSLISHCIGVIYCRKFVVTEPCIIIKNDDYLSNIFAGIVIAMIALQPILVGVALVVLRFPQAIYLNNFLSLELFSYTHWLFEKTFRLRADGMLEPISNWRTIIVQIVLFSLYFIASIQCAWRITMYRYLVARCMRGNLP